MQCTSGVDGELAKRTRYYQAIIDMELLSKGNTYDHLNPSFIIFICTFDLFGKGLPIYTFQNRCDEDNAITLGDKGTKIFLNSTGNTTGIDPDIAAFLQYVTEQTTEGTFIQELTKEVRRIKEHDETRREYMTLAMELERKKQEGIQEGLELTAIAMLKDNISKDTIAKYTHLSLDTINKLAQKSN